MRRTAFLGTPHSAVPALRSLAALTDVAVVVTRPDRAGGRGRQPQSPPIKQAALDLHLRVAQPNTTAELHQVIADQELDLAVVAAFGMILPAETLTLPRLGMVNVHFSLLPRWRGAAPVERSILAGDSTSGITLMQMDAGLDTGPLLVQWETAIGLGETGGELTERLSVAGGEVLASNLGGLLEASLPPQPQSEDAATYAPMLSPDEARLDPAGEPSLLHRAIRAFDPRPGARFQHVAPIAAEAELFKVFSPTLSVEHLEPGALRLQGDRLLIGTATSAVGVHEVQPAGRRRMRAADWARGLHGGLGRLT